MSIVLLAVYVSLGRMLSSLTGVYQREILQELNYRVPFLIDAEQVRAEWHSFTPVLVLDGLRFTLPGELGHSLELSEGRIALDVVGSLLTRSLQMSQLRLDGLDLAAELGGDGRLRIRGFEGTATRLEGWLEEFLANVERVVLGEGQLDLALPDGESVDFALDLALSREGSRRRLEGTLSSSRGLQVYALGEGVGHPFVPGSFKGQLYLDIDAVDVGPIANRVADALGAEVQVDGSLGLQLWWSWDRGEPGAVFQLTLEDVLLRAPDASWQQPLDRLALDASLAFGDSGWFLAVADLELALGEVLLQVPRLQLDVRGETLDLRAQGLPLAPLGQLLAGGDAPRVAAVDLVKELQPRGILPALQLTVSDISAPLAGWQLLATFDEVAVDPWHGAPGVTGAGGYARLQPGSGSVVLDSQQFSMTFPTVYELPLQYEDFHGTINLRWDKEAVALRSGLVEALGEEGPVRVLFGLSIPVVPDEVGLEMDLLVGLENTEAIHRNKYIPFILSAPLRRWLAASIGGGMIEQGGFLWRGSLTAPSPTLHTVQLFFNLQDTALGFHPDWPPLAYINGTVLIDDSNVSVWAASAQLFESRATDLSVEVWQDEATRLWLAVDGSLTGPAADGLAVVNNSPLRQFAGAAFQDWQLTGALATDLEFLLNLSDSTVKPQVRVSARFTDVDLDIHPGGLPLREINGILDYDTGLGFSSRDLAGQLWGRPLQALVGQRPGQAEPAAAGEHPAVTVDVSTMVDMDDIQQWLGLDLLGFARGQAAVNLELLAGEGAPPRLHIESELVGVGLDLPAPWGKAADTGRRLQITAALGGDSLPLDLHLDLDPDETLTAQLELVDGKLHAAAVALGSYPVELQSGRVRIGGRTAFADASDWQRFLAAYFVPAPGPEAGPEQRQQLMLSVDQLEVDRLVLDGRDLGRVRLGLADDGGHWRVTANTDWLRGNLLYIPGGRSLLNIDYLDLAGLEGLDLAAADDVQIIELPELAVTIEELRRGDTVLGNLAFDLLSDGPDLRARQISGEIAALQLRAEDPGEMLWHQGPDSRTTLASSLSFQDLGLTLERLGYQKTIETRQGSFGLALEWPGGPQDFTLQAGRGSLLVDIGEGHFPDVPVGTAGTLRVVSILNLAEIVRRLSLSQMFESGISFNKVDGEVFLHAGTIEVASMDVQGSASGFQFSGTAAVASRTLGGELVVTLPVANNLPWVAALTAGLPVAAGVFLLSKVFESQVNRLTSAVYAVGGTWDDPSVTFDRVFDDTAAAGVGTSRPGATSPVPDQAGSP